MTAVHAPLSLVPAAGAVAARESWRNSPLLWVSKWVREEAPAFLSFALKSIQHFLQTEQDGFCTGGLSWPDPEAEPGTARPLRAVNF